MNTVFLGIGPWEILIVLATLAIPATIAVVVTAIVVPAVWKKRPQQS